MKKTFQHHTPSPLSVEKIRRLRKAYSDLAELIEEVCPASRERSVGLTELETSAMWSIKSVVINDGNSVVEE